MINYDNVLFNIDISSGTPHAGALLVAEPFLRDEYFRHSVICLIEHGQDTTSMGIVLNHPTHHTLSDLIPSLEDMEAITVYCGGPVATDRLYFLHSLGDIIPGASEVAPGLWIGGEFEAMLGYIRSGYPIEGKLRFFIGYSGWDRHQLAGELKDKVWAVTEIPSTANMLEGDGDAYWHRSVRALGDRFRGWRFHPQNPHAN